MVLTVKNITILLDNSFKQKTGNVESKTEAKHPYVFRPVFPAKNQLENCKKKEWSA